MAAVSLRVNGSEVELSSRVSPSIRAYGASVGPEVTNVTICVNDTEVRCRERGAAIVLLFVCTLVSCFCADRSPAATWLTVRAPGSTQTCSIPLLVLWPCRSL